MYSGSVYGQRCGQIRVSNDTHVVIVLGWKKHSKIAPPAEKRKTENREETHQLLYVVNFAIRDDNHVVRQSRELISLLQLWYCNSVMLKSQEYSKIIY